MAGLIVQAGGGVYARLQASGDGWVALEFGEVAGGAFYPAGGADACERIFAPLYDGAGWNLALVGALIRHKRPAKVESKLLTTLLATLRERYPQELQKHLQLAVKDGDDWVRIAALIRRCAEQGLIGEGTLHRYAASGVYPTFVRQAARQALALAI